MKKRLLFSALVLLLAICLSGIHTAEAKPPNLMGLWVGSVRGTIFNGGIDNEFFSQHMEIDIFFQQGVRFSGTMLIGSNFADRFNITGVINGTEILITGSSSSFEGELSGTTRLKIHGVGSRFQTDAFPSTTVVFNLRKD